MLRVTKVTKVMLLLYPANVLRVFRMKKKCIFLIFGPDQGKFEGHLERFLSQWRAIQNPYMPVRT